MGVGRWRIGVWEWGLGPIPNPQSPIPNPQSPIKFKQMIKRELNNLKKLYKLRIYIIN